MIPCAMLFYGRIFGIDDGDDSFMFTENPTVFKRSNFCQHLKNIVNIPWFQRYSMRTIEYAGSFYGATKTPGKWRFLERVLLLWWWSSDTVPESFPNSTAPPDYIDIDIILYSCVYPTFLCFTSLSFEDIVLGCSRILDLDISFFCQWRRQRNDLRCTTPSCRVSCQLYCY